MQPRRSKLPGLGTTIFTVMSQLANDCDAINLSQGFPDFADDRLVLALEGLQIAAVVEDSVPGVAAGRAAGEIAG